jgi:guanylate kinase
MAIAPLTASQDSSMGTTPTGRLIIISGPSGSGKSTLLKRLFEVCPAPLVASVSATTRPPRPGEVNGVDYHFMSKEEFLALKERGEFLECFEVYQGGHWYGTLRREVDPGLKAGNWVVLEIDVQGTLALLPQYPDAVTIFVEPGSLEELERRLRNRGTESEAAIQRRLEGARREMRFADRYRYRVVNDNLDRCLAEICELITKRP